MIHETTKNYSNRQVDLEMLKHVDRLLRIQRVHPDVHTSPRITAGIEKLVQRYAKLFLTHIGSCKLDPKLGSNILHEVWAGRVSNMGYLMHLYAIANVNTVKSLQEDDINEALFGTIPDDERLDKVQLIELKLDYATRTVKVHVKLITRSGDMFTFIIPVGSGIQ